MHILDITYYVGLAILAYALAYSLYISKKIKNAQSDKELAAKYSHPMYRQFTNGEVQVTLVLLLGLLIIFSIFDKLGFPHKGGVELSVSMVFMVMIILAHTIRKYSSTKK